MLFPQIWLIMSLVCVGVFSIPREIEYGNTTNISKNSSSISDTKSNSPLVIIVEEKNRNSGSLFLEFVYNGNSIKDSNTAEKNKYTISSKTDEKMLTKKHNLTKNEVTKPIKVTNVKMDSTKQEKGQAFTARDNLEKIKVTSLTINEESPLLQKWPKYFFDVFNPIKPFPELQTKSINKIQNKKPQTSISDAYKLTSEKQKKPQDTAGPRLNPSSIYEREFMQPIFD